MEKIMLFGASDDDYRQLKQISSRMKLVCETFTPASYAYTLEELMNQKTPQSILALSDTAADESLLVMCELSDKRMDKLLFEIRRVGIRIDYKAVLTPTNRKWTVSQLLLEMRKEKNAYERMKP